MKVLEKAPLPLNQKAANNQLIPDRFNDIAGSMEQQFAELMLEEMKKTVDKNDPESGAEAYYNSLMQQEYAKQLSKGEDGMGLKKIILNQIYPAHMRNEINYHRFQQAQKPSIAKAEVHEAPIEMKGKE